MLCVLAVWCAASAAYPLRLRYKFRKGDTHRINSLIREDVFVNDTLAHTAEITNRITVHVSEVRVAHGSAPDAARYVCHFMTSEKSPNNTFRWGRHYESIFWRDAFGVYDIDRSFFMPVVRNVPVFPDYDIEVGDTWEHEAEEAHDLRDGFGIQTPFIVPFTVSYTYRGEVQRGSRRYHHITAAYSMSYESPKRTHGVQRNAKEGMYPVRTTGVSKQNLYWDNELGNIAEYDDEFRILLYLSGGTVLRYRGTATAKNFAPERFDPARTVVELQETLKDLHMPDAKVRETEEGVTISIENVQFDADSASLAPSEYEKLRKIAELLRAFPDRELLVSGHAARRGSVQDQQRISEERADVVARYLQELGVVDAAHVYTRGCGAQQSIAPNDSEDGRRKNRRVEITIISK